MEENHATQTQNEGPVDPARLEEYLRQQPGWEDNLPLLGLDRVGLGQSNLTFRLRLTNRNAILRRPPQGPLPPKAHDVLREYRVMQAFYPTHVPVPQPLLACEDPAVIGAPFFIMDAVPGDAIRFHLPDDILSNHAALRSIGLQLAEGLARLHNTNPASVGLQNLGKPEGYIKRQLVLFSKQLDMNRTRPTDDLDWTARWLEENLPPETTRPTFIHGDYKLDNVLFSLHPEPKLRAIVDWELCTLGDPLADLGWMLAFWAENGTPPAELTIMPRLTEQPGFPTRAELAAHYASLTGIELPDLTYYMAFATWKLAIVLEGHWARHVRGTAGDFDFGYLEQGGPAMWAYLRRLALGEYR
jgi:aminoglycoside phosphotransferase (APT) family kinase protein